MKELLVSLLPAINGIHGGCFVCLEHFTQRANAALIEQRQPYYLVVARQQEAANLGIVTLVDIPAPVVTRKRKSGETPA